MEDTDIKYLKFIHNGAQSFFELAESSYCALRKRTVDVSPQAVKQVVESAEHTLKPYLGSCFNLTESILKWAESLVKSGVTMGTEAVENVQARSKSTVEGIQSRVCETLKHEYVSDVKNTAQTRYSSAHEAIVTSPTYASVYQTALLYSQWALNLPIVRDSAGAVYRSTYPRLKPVVDPVVSTCTPYVKALEEHLEPRAGQD